jgi:hypothetical protein
MVITLDFIRMPFQAYALDRSQYNNIRKLAVNINKCAPATV